MSLQRMHYLDWLRGFVAVGKHLSFRKAAEELCLTQSAISKQVLALESLLGIKLFVRHPRSIEFTESGYALYLTARQSLDQIHVAVSNLQGSERSNIVKISTSVGFAGLWLLPRLASFYDEHPGVDIQVSADNRNISDLSDHGIDQTIRPPGDPVFSVAWGSRSVADKRIPMLSRGKIFLEFPRRIAQAWQYKLFRHIPVYSPTMR